jgi:hypothetical protein
METIPPHFIEAKKQRIARCVAMGNCDTQGKWRCGRCRRLGQKLCRAYHGISDPQQELNARLLYEFVFGMISEEDLVRNEWAAAHLRDWGHGFRIQKLRALACNSC